MSLSESTKQRALRIDLDHHKRPEPLARAKWMLAIVAALASVAYAAYIYAPGSGGQAQLSSGPVADVHGAFNNRCSECHDDFHAVRGDAWALNKGEFDAKAGAWTSDAKCIGCHAAPAHHANIKEDQQHWIGNCASCHQDHQGSSVSLTRIDDAHCTRCHVRIADIVGEPTLKNPDISRIKSFADRHPEFRSIAAGDPGKIQFNHALHMRPGLTKTGDGRALSKYEDLPSDYLSHAIEGWDAAKPQAGAVQLQCASCHESSTSDDRLAFSSKKDKTTRNTAHFAPIQFDRHCQACHALKIGPEENDVVPHGLKASELKQIVFAFLLQKQDEPASKSGLEEYESRLLGKPRKELAGAALVDDADGRLNGIRTHLATTCTKCHSYADGENPFTGNVLPANIPQFWFQHGRFNHASHRAMDCAHCHGEATTATKSSAVMIPNYKACVECHSSAGSVEATSDLARQFAGARSDCVECHTYHGANIPHAHPRLGRTP
jgi:hypothetical protein